MKKRMKIFNERKIFASKIIHFFDESIKHQCQDKYLRIKQFPYMRIYVLAGIDYNVPININEQWQVYKYPEIFYFYLFDAL